MGHICFDVVALSKAPHPHVIVFADLSVFDDIEENINNIKSEDENMAVCLLADFNARTGILPDVSHNYESGDQSVELCEILNSNSNVTICI